MSRTPSKGWDLVLLMDVDDDVEEVHIIPTDDLIPHECSDECVCGPSPELREDGVWMYSHESLDRREDDE